jgi:twinkle protein
MRIVPDTIDLSAYLNEPEPGENVRPASDWLAEVKEDILNPQAIAGARTPWGKAEALIRFRTGEVSLWPGVNGSFKSMVTTQVALGLCQQDERVCIASMEMKPRKTMKRMLLQAAANPEPSVRFIDKFHVWTDGRLWIFDHMGSIKWERMVAVVRYAVEKFGVTHFFVDSLMKCVQGEDDYNGQKAFVSALCDVAQTTGVHIHLVHHTRKLGDDAQKPSKFDAKGSGSITDQVDNVFSVWRNKPKEKDLEADRFKSDADREDCEGQPDVLIICDKQRHGEWEGKISLWMDRRSMVFRGEQRGFSTGMEL